MRGKTGNVKTELEQGKHHYDKYDLPTKIEDINKKYGELITKYCNRIPANLIAARIWLESRGNPKAIARAQKWRTGYGSEMGLLMISPDSRKQYGLTEEQCRDPETNIKYGCIIWNKWVDVFFRERLMPENDPLARACWAWLVTAIGPGATRRLRKLSDGYAFDRLEKVVNDKELMERNKRFWGSQSPALIAWRVGVAIGVAKTTWREETAPENNA